MNKVKASQETVIRVAKDTLGQISNPFTLPTWLPELKDKTVVRADSIAGLTVALILIPQSMAYAQLAGLPAYYGLYAALLPTMIAAFFGSSRQLATGPVAMVSLMTAAALEPLATAGSEAFVGYAVLLALMVGLFQLTLGLFRLGVLLNFLSHPVILGFVNAAAIIIGTSQLGKIFGVSADKGEYHYEFVMNTLKAASENTHWPTLAMAVLAFAIMFGVRRYKPKLPSVLVAVIATTVLAWMFGFEQHTKVKAEQIADQKMRTALMYDVLEAKRITNLKEKLIAAQKDHDAKAEGSEDDNVTLLTERQSLEQFKFQLDQLKEKSGSYHKELFNTPLYSMGEGESIRFYTEAEISELNLSGEKDGSLGQPWFIKSYRNGVVGLQTGGRVIGEVPKGLPGFSMPKFEWSAIMHLIGATITISLIGFMEAISIAKAMAARTRQSLSADRELIGQGMSNIVGSLFQSYPVSGSFSRSAVNINAGAVTGFSSVISVIIVAFTLMFLTPLLYYLPQATLAAVIMMAVAGLVSIKPAIHAWQANRHDGIVAGVTFVFTLAFAPQLEMGIIFGMLLSLVLLLFRIMKPRVAFPPHMAHQFPAEAIEDGIIEDNRVVRMRFEGSLVFANVAFFEEQLQKILASTPQLKVLIIDAVSIPEVDASGDQMLRDYYRRLTESGIRMLFSRVRKPILAMFERSHMYEDIPEGCFHRNPVNVFTHAWALIQEADEKEEVAETDEIVEIEEINEIRETKVTDGTEESRKTGETGKAKD
ncbi:MAG: SulP family inorganic anion transporter, partial [Xanthomonadales bacterium]|nr:SulP family inorganic anion transporter [Xanthomonadales bacterium]